MAEIITLKEGTMCWGSEEDRDTVITNLSLKIDVKNGMVAEYIVEYELPYAEDNEAILFDTLDAAIVKFNELDSIAVKIDGAETFGLKEAVDQLDEMNKAASPSMRG